MDDQDRNHEALIDRFAEQARIIRHRNDRITEVEARANELALELAHAATRAEKAEQERDEALDDAESLRRQLHDAQQDADMSRAELESEQPRPFAADDITDEARKRAADAWWTWKANGAASISGLVDAILAAALPEPTRPEGAEKVEAVLHQYWSGDINGDDLADRIVEEMNR